MVARSKADLTEALVFQRPHDDHDGVAWLPAAIFAKQSTLPLHASAFFPVATEREVVSRLGGGLDDLPG